MWSSNGRTLLVMCDYYSNFIEVALLKSTTSRWVIRDMSEVFARFGVADILVTDITLRISHQLN